ECQKFMKSYLKCLKDNQNNNGKCRLFAKDYLECRMQRGLMGEDDFKNLGFQDLLPSNGSTTEASPASQGSGSNAGSKSRSETAAPEAKATGTGAGTGSVGSKVNGSQ
ncbi:Cytochrome c oxidase assembly protein cox19, partial [Lunasporangiospora selenospora]